MTRSRRCFSVVMPGAGSPQVRARIRELQPGMAVMFCTGYSRQMPAESAVSDDEAIDLPLKPYSPRTLLERVREALAAKAREGGAATAGPIV